MTAMAFPALHIRPPRNQLTWRGLPGETWAVVQRATQALLNRWRPDTLVLTRTRFDEHDLPGGSHQADQLRVHDERILSDALVDVSEILATDPIDARVAMPTDHDDATTLQFVDPDQRERQARLIEAPDLGAWRTYWFSAGCPLQRGFVLYIPARGHIEAQWDRGIFAGNPEPSDWQRLDHELDEWLAKQLRGLRFADG